MSELRKRFEENFEKANQTGKWMAAVWSVKDGELKLDVTTHDFPNGDMIESVRMLSVKLGEMVAKATTPPEPEPLECATILPWLNKQADVAECAEGCDPIGEVEITFSEEPEEDCSWTDDSVKESEVVDNDNQ